MLTWLIVIVAMLGTVLNVKRDRRGFILWIVSNLALAVINARGGEWAQATLWIVYVVMAVWGWVSWGKSLPVTVDKETCSSCANGYNGKNGNGYQPCGCHK